MANKINFRNPKNDTIMAGVIIGKGYINNAMWVYVRDVYGDQ